MNDSDRSVQKNMNPIECIQCTYRVQCLNVISFVGIEQYKFSIELNFKVEIFHFPSFRCSFILSVVKMKTSFLVL